MKVSASKKTIVILIILFVLLLLGGICFLYKDVINNGIKYGRWFSVDKYEELLDDCEWERKGGELRIKCRALLYPGTDADKNIPTHCLNFIMIPKDFDKGVKTFNICEEIQNLQWEQKEEWLNAKSLMPVRYTLIYNHNNSIDFQYSSLGVQHVDEKEYFGEFLKNKSLAKKGYAVSLDSSTPEQFNNYISMDKETFDIQEMGHIYIFATELLKKEVKGEDIYITLKSQIEKEEVSFTLASNSILLSKGEGNFVNITTENIDDLEIHGKYQIQMAYLTNKPEDLTNKVEDMCKEDDILKHREPLCNNKKIVLDDKYKATSKEEIIKEILLKKDDVFLQNVLLYYMITIDEK